MGLLNHTILGVLPYDGNSLGSADQCASGSVLVKSLNHDQASAMIAMYHGSNESISEAPLAGSVTTGAVDFLFRLCSHDYYMPTLRLDDHNSQVQIRQWFNVQDVEEGEQES